MKFTEQERDFLKQEFADLCHAAINSMITAGSFVRSIDRIEAIVSERVTTEQDTIKPYHEHGNSVASDRTESGQSADEKALSALSFVRTYQTNNQRDWLKIYEDVVAGIVLHYASQVCADKDADIQDMTALRESAMRTVKNLADRIEPLQNEIDRLNESMTVMVNMNAELQDQIERFKNPLKAK